MSSKARQLETIAELLRQESTLALATIDDHGEPCVAPLFYLADQALSLFWLSSPSSRHSVNLARTPRAAATVYRHAEQWREICGVQMRGAVTSIDEPSRRKALIKQYCERFQLGTIFHLTIGRSCLYEFRPDFFRYLDNSKRWGYRFELWLRADNPGQSA